MARMSPVTKIKEIQKAVTIPVMAKCRIGHFVEAQILESLGVDFIDECEVLTPADEHFHVDKFAFKVPFVCGCARSRRGLRRIGEGAAMMRTKGEAGSGNIVEAVRHMRAVTSGIRRLTMLGHEELMTEAKNLGAPYELVRWVAKSGHLPVPNFSAGGIATPADAALMMQLGAEAVFVGSGIFKSSDPAVRAKAIVAGDHALQGSRRPGQGLRGARRRDARHRDVQAEGVRPPADPRLVGAVAWRGAAEGEPSGYKREANDGEQEGSRSPPASTRPAGAGGRRRLRPPSGVAGAGRPAVVDVRPVGGSGGDLGPADRALLLPANRRGRAFGRARVGRHPRRAGLHAPELRLPRPAPGVRRAGRGGLRGQHPGDRVPAGVRGAQSRAVRDAERPRSRADPRAAAADLRVPGHAGRAAHSDQAHGLVRGAGTHRADLVSGLPAGPERGDRARVASRARPAACPSTGER